MQNAKDTFYVVLRDRLAALNPARTTIVRGVTRPALIVDENELPDRGSDEGVFHLRWTTLSTHASSSVPLDLLECEIHYSACGGDALSTLARGRELAAMDEELSAILKPANIPKQSFDENGSTSLGTNIFWCEEGERSFAQKGDAISRVATVLVMSCRKEAA